MSLPRCLHVCTAIVWAIPCLVLAGWILEIDALKRVLPGFVAMNPATAIGFLAGGAGLALAKEIYAQALEKREALCAPYASVIDVKAEALPSAAVDRWLFPIGSKGNPMAPTTACDFLLAGTGFLLRGAAERGRRKASQACAILVVIGAALALTGYAYDIEKLYRVAAFMAMAVHTAFAFLALGLGLLCAHRSESALARIASPSAGGAMLRRLLGWTILVPLALGWVALRGQRAGWCDPAFSFATFVILVVGFLSALLWRNAAQLDRHEAKRGRTGEALRRARDEMEGRVQARTAELRGVLEQVSGVVVALHEEAGDILRAVGGVAAGTHETASAVAETTATVEEVKQTAQLTSERLRRVAAGAQRAAEVAELGRHSVDETIVGMHRIREGVDQLGAGMERLSEQTLAIGEINAAVKDLAERLAILAVNAAIEAATAGEHGKGFRVVALEVRNLAEQSRQATAQVRAILSENQKGTAAAVLATADSSRAVDDGLHQAAQAGAAIAELAETVSDSAGAAAQVAAASQQQAVGMDQVATAIRSIHGASAENAAAVTQLEGSARELRKLGARLRALVENVATEG